MKNPNIVVTDNREQFVIDYAYYKFYQQACRDHELWDIIAD